MTSTTRPLLGIGAGLTAVSGWACYSLAARQGLADGFTPLQLSALRYFVPAVCLSPLLLFGLWWRLKNVGLPRAAVLCLLAGPFYGYGVMYGLTLAPVSHAVVLGPSFLLLTTFLIDWWFDGRAPMTRQIFGGVLLLVGVAILASRPSHDYGANRWVGDLLFAVSGVAMGLFTVLTRRWRIGPVDALAGVAFLGPVIIIPAMPQMIESLPRAIGWQPVVWQILAQGLIGGLVAMLAYVAAIRLLGAARAAFFPGFVPGVTIAIAGAVGLEAWSARSTVGAALATIGLIVAQLAPATTSVDARSPTNA